MRTFVLFALTLTATAAMASDAWAFGKRRGGCNGRCYGRGYASGCSGGGYVRGGCSGGGYISGGCSGGGYVSGGCSGGHVSGGCFGSAYGGVAPSMTYPSSYVPNGSAVYYNGRSPVIPSSATV